MTIILKDLSFSKRSNWDEKPDENLSLFITPKNIIQAQRISTH